MIPEIVLVSPTLSPLGVSLDPEDRLRRRGRGVIRR